MGLTVSALFSRIFGKKQMRILMGEADQARGPDRSVGPRAALPPPRPSEPSSAGSLNPSHPPPNPPAVTALGRVAICSADPGA